MDLSSTYQKPAKMSFSIENLAKSSRSEKSEHTQPAVINFNDSMFTPVKLQSEVSPMTSTPLSLPLALQNSDLKLKRKRNHSFDSENSSLNSTDSKSRDCISPNSTTDDSDSNTSESRKRARVAFTNNQVNELEKRYKSSKYLPIEERAGIAQRLNLSEQQIKTWFQNRRMKEKRQQKDGKTSYFPSGGVEASQLAAMGIPCPPPHNVSGTQSTQMPGYFSHQQYPASPASQQVFDPRFVPSYMYGYTPMSSVMFSGYSQNIYNGLSPKIVQQHRV
ncbi:homeobox protein ceh-30-like [Mytilus edulis]|uniref:homeobox protein ceh-30-like n=1 Tax=Mytilus edulis TaxID=6550 RepID=UPI0039EF1B37